MQTQRKWLDEGLKVFPISVNVSKRQLYNPYFAEEYIEIKIDINYQMVL